MQKVVVVQPIAREGMDLLIKQGYDVQLLQDRSLDNLCREFAEADAVLVRTAAIPRAAIECGQHLKIIARHGVGFENIDVQAATERGIQVTNTPEANSIAVAEHVLGLMLVLAKNMRRIDRAIREGCFSIRDECLGMQLEGKTLSIIGLGRIGHCLGRKAAAGLGLRVIGFDPFINEVDVEPVIEVCRDWERVFREADFLSLNLPLTESTRGIVNQKVLRIMKATAYLINCSRGPVVMEEDLVEALRKGWIAGAGLDVFEIEPPVGDNPLFAMENTILTPHMAAHTRESMVNMAVGAAQGIIDVLSGRAPAWPVNRVFS